MCLAAGYGHGAQATQACKALGVNKTGGWGVKQNERWRGISLPVNINAVTPRLCKMCFSCIFQVSVSHPSGRKDYLEYLPYLVV